MTAKFLDQLSVNKVGWKFQYLGSILIRPAFDKMKFDYGLGIPEMH